jgi:hypothetical protein
MHVARPYFGCIYHRHRRRSGNRNDEPNQEGKGKTGQGREFQPESMARAKMANHAKSKQKNPGRNRSQRNQRNVDGAMQVLTRAATSASHEVVLVVATHFKRNAGNIVAPARQDLADNGINAFTHSPLQPDRFHRLGLCRQQQAIVQQRLLRAQGLFCRLAGQLGVIILLGEMRQHYV